MPDQSAMDVTPRILQSVQTYGSSDYTNPAYASSNRSLNYHEGGSIQRPEKDRVTVIPYSLKFEDKVGLFGKENHFVRVDVKVDKGIALLVSRRLVGYVQQLLLQMLRLRIPI